MPIFSLLIVFSITIDVKSELAFAVTEVDDGAFIPYLKDKGVGYSFGEDSFVTTPYGIAVADGVGSSTLASRHIANHLTTTFGQWILGCRYYQKPPEDLVQLCNIKENINEHEIINDVMSEIMIKGVKDADKPLTDSGLKDNINLFQSSTFVSAYFSPEDPAKNKKAMLNVFQKGDSLALIMRFDPVKRNWKPLTYTSDGQEAFNTPYQYTMTSSSKPGDFSGDDFNRFLSIEPQANDVVILGSDGLFDNVPISIIVLAFNSLVGTVAKNYGLKIDELTKPNPRVCLKKLLVAYQELVGKLDKKAILESDPVVPGKDEYDLSDFTKYFETIQEEDDRPQQQQGMPQEPLTKESENDRKFIKPSTRINKNKPEQQNQKQKKIIQTEIVQDDGLKSNIKMQEERVGEEQFGSVSQTTSSQSNKPGNDPKKGLLKKPTDLTGEDNIQKHKISENTKKDVQDVSFSSARVSKNDIDEGKHTTSQTDVSKNDPQPENQNAQAAEKCKIKRLFYRRKTNDELKDWGFEGLLDPCFVGVLDKLFAFSSSTVDKFTKAFDPKLFSFSIAEFAKELTNEPYLYPSLFWIEMIENGIKKQRSSNSTRPPVFTKPDDITVVAALVFERDTTEKGIKLATIQEKLIFNRLDFMEKRNKMELEQDLLFKKFLRLLK